MSAEEKKVEDDGKPGFDAATVKSLFDIIGQLSM